MDNTRQPHKVSGQLSWGDDHMPVAQVAIGPLTKKPIEKEADVSTPSSSTASDSTSKRSRRSRKSDSAFRTISEVADILDVQQHVLRFWETKFTQVKPLKRGGGRRYYRPEDVALLQRIHGLLYTEGYTIKGVQKLLKEQGKKALIANVASPVAANGSEHPVAVQTQDAVAVASKPDAQAKLQDVLNELKDLRALVSPSE